MPFDDPPTAPNDPTPNLYAKREAIHPKLVTGKYRVLKWIVLAGTLGVYYLLPWLRYPRAAHEPSQAVLVDFEGSRLYFFGLEIWPDEFYLVTGILVLAALALFLFTAVWGRLWCGFTCPQTVWTDLFIAVERMIEGDRNQRLALAKKPWTGSKIAKKLSKHSIWVLIAALTGGAWVMYFHDAPTVARGLFTGDAPATSYIFICILTFTTYALAGLMREQVCTYMCPWPRIQGALTDSRTFQVGYFVARGEPRGKHKKGQDWSDLGDCIDCKACVVACPMGIDIRDGDQMECINCGLCVDACDTMMKKVGLPKGLVAFGNNYLDAKTPEERRRFPQLFRTRYIVYLVIIGLVSALVSFGVVARDAARFGLERDRAPAFTMLSDGSIRNAADLKLLNKESVAQTYIVSVTGPETLDVAAVGHDVLYGQFTMLVPADRHGVARIFFVLPEQRRNPETVSVTITTADGTSLGTQSFEFLRPNR